MSNPPETRGSELPQAIEHAAACYEDGRLEEALEACEDYLATHPGHFDATHLAGVVKLALGDPAGALPMLAEAVKLRPRSCEVVLNYGVALLDTGDAAGALAQTERALALRTDIPEAHNNRGNALRTLGRHEEALACYEKALALRFDYPDALSNRGAALLDLGRPDDALQSCAQAIALQPEFAQALFNRGNALRELGRYHRAIASYDEALRYQPGYRAALTNKIAILTKLDRNEEALAAARQAIARDPGHVDALVNCGVAAQRLGRLAEAVVAYADALKIVPDHVAALRNRGAALRDLGQPAEALASFEKLIAVKPGDADALYERGEALRALGRPAEALASFERALAVEPNHAYALGSAAFAALNLCEWEKAERFAGAIEPRVADDGMVVSPFVLLNVSASPQLHLAGARNFATTFQASPLPPRLPPARRGGKIRIAYLSADFREHPVGHMIAELIERHDRAQFDVHGICFSPDDASDARARLIKAFDRFQVLRGDTDAGAARRIRDLDVDIAIDLNGYTQNCRPAIFAARPAPIQVNYLGYAGTMGADFIDYIIADAVALPLDDQPFVTEKIVHLPDCYHAYDTTRAIAAQAPTREAAGLPASGFVFCCFNNGFKIARPVFEAWMRLLARVEGSVLWLRHTNDAACERLQLEAIARDIEPARLVFAGRVPLAEHLGRHRVADLFLDTLPYNGHTTASDALWAGLPVLTCKGTAFPGRVGASMLGAIGLPDLVAPDLAAYEALALRLATEPKLLADAKRRLEKRRNTAALFDIDRFRRHIEAAYSRMDELRRSGTAPQSFAVEAKSKATADEDDDEAKAEEAKGEGANGEGAKVEEAKVEDAKGEEAKVEDPAAEVKAEEK
jgi:protein O-GlcNAc transferase